MSVQYRDTDTLACDNRAGCRNNFSVLYFTPDSKRLFLTLLLFATNVRNYIFNHFRPVFKSLASSGNRLISSCYYFIWFKLFPCSQNRCITLDRAVWLYSNKASCGSETFLLCLNNIKMFRINFRHYHWHIRCPAVCAVVGYNRGLCLCIFFFNLLNLFFGHINC